MKKKFIFAMSGVFSLCVLAIVFRVLALPVTGAADKPVTNYKTAMIDLIADLHQYANKTNPSFELMGNNGLSMFAVSEDNSQENVDKLMSSVGGIIMEEHYYGWEMKDDRLTPGSVQQRFSEGLAQPKKNGLPILNIDYCTTQKHIADAYEKNDANGLIGFAAIHRQLDMIPEGIHAENQKDIYTLKDIQNYLVLLNPDRFKSKEQYLHALQATNYDLLIIDLMFDGDILTAEDIRTLQQKKNGAKRLVFAYMSVGEAEDYRPYWKAEWKQKRPNWIAEENEDWEGNFKVKYWTKEWRQLLYGSKDAYLDQILATGFDGAFLDVVDAYEYFQAKQEERSAK